MHSVERRREDDTERQAFNDAEREAINAFLEQNGAKVVPSCRRGELPHAMTQAERRGHEAGLGHTRRAAWRR